MLWPILATLGLTAVVWYLLGFPNLFAPIGSTPYFLQYRKSFVPLPLGTRIHTFVGTLAEAMTKSTVNGRALGRKTLVFTSRDTWDGIPPIWGDDMQVRAFTPDMLELKALTEDATGEQFDVCLVNYYKTGKNTIGWHADLEERGSTKCIASVSLGSERVFQVRSSYGLWSQLLANGSLLVMRSPCQDVAQHRVVKTSRAGSRTNLTFRKFH